MKTVLLTGVAGFIGAHTLEHLLDNTSWDIIGVDSLKHRGNYARIEQVLAKNPVWAARFVFIEWDLSVQWNYNLIPDADYIINMAAESHVDRSIMHPVPFVKNNVDLTLNMLEWARYTKPEVFIQISTDEVYGPMLDGRPYSEGERHLPSNPYSASKSAQESIAIAYWRTYGVPLVITNTMNNIGEMQDVEKFVPMLVSHLLKGEKVKIHGSAEDMGSRFYLHARNHADALLFILRNTTPAIFDEKTIRVPDRYNIAGDVEVDNLAMAKWVADLVGKPLDYEFDTSSRPGHDLHYGLDGSKLRGLGWHPPFSFQESLKRTVENYLEHKEWLS